MSDLCGLSRTRYPKHVIMVLLFFSVVVPDGPVGGRELAFDLSPADHFPPLVILTFYVHVNSLTMLPRRGSAISM